MFKAASSSCRLAHLHSPKTNTAAPAGTSGGLRGFLILSVRLRSSQQSSSTPSPHQSSTAAVPPHEGVASDWVDHLDEGQGPNCDLTGALRLETRLLVKGNQEFLTHEDSSADAGQTAEVLQIAPHQDGAFALLTEGPVDGQDVDVNRGTVRFMEGEGVLEDRQTSDVFRGSALIRGPERFLRKTEFSPWSASLGPTVIR